MLGPFPSVTSPCVCSVSLVHHPDDSVTGEILLEAAIAFLEERDEATFRISDICSRTNLSSSVIYARFSSRQGLIDAALVEIYRRVCRESLDHSREWVELIKSQGSVVAVWKSVLADDANRTDALRRRALQMRVLSTSLTRNAVKGAVTEIHDEYLHELGELFGQLVDLGLLGAGLSGLQWAGLLSSLWMNDLIAANSVSRDVVRWLEMAERVIGPSRS